MNPKPLVLLVDEDENNIFLLRRAFSSTRMLCETIEVPGTEEAIRYFEGQGLYADRLLHPFPDLVILSVNAPEEIRLDLLAWLHQHRELSHIRVVLVSTSAGAVDLADIRKLGIIDYQVRPNDSSNLTRLAKDLLTKWLNPDAHLAVS